ncbi:MAG: phage tail protein [Alphaproteobacteria bacterium]|nr:phage tail protein [Alphaproteobacteria bacterium]
MGGILGHTSNAKQRRAVGSLQFQTSEAGGAIPLIYGTTKVSPNLVDYDDFRATPSKQAGGKGKGGGGGKGGGQQYMYSASFIMGICQGPIAGFGMAWWDKNIGTVAGLPSISSINLGADGQAVDGYWASVHPAKAVSYSGTVNIVFANYQLGNTATLPNFTFEVIGIGAGVSRASPNGYDANPAYIISDFLTNPRYGANFPLANLDPAMTSSAAFSYASYCAALGLFLSPLLDQQQEAQQSLAEITQVTNSAIVWSGALLKIIPYGDHSVTNAFTVASFTGAPTQGGGDTISLTFTDPALQGGAPYTVTYTTLPYLQMPGAMAGLAQAVNSDPNLVRFGILASGVGLAGVMIIQSSPTGNTMIGQSGGGGIAAAGIGTTTTNSFAPNTTPVYSLGEDDYIVQESSVGINGGAMPGGPALRAGGTPVTGGFADDPLHIVRSTPADANNMIEVECLDRQNNYNTTIAEAFDQGSIDRYGVRRDTSTKARLITDPLYVGGMVAQLLLQRHLLYRNTYTFQLGWKYILLEPMDLVQITDSRLGASALTVRITAVEEDDEGMLSITAEDFFGPYSPTVLYPPANLPPAASPSILGIGGGTATPTVKQASGAGVGGFVPNWSAAPGNVNAPLIFEPPAALLSGDLEIWIALSGGPSWGGAQVWISSDGNSYAFAGTVSGAATQGILTAGIGNTGGNPDTTDNCSVDLTESRGQLLSVSTTDAANLVTLCYMGGELFAYQTAGLTSAYHYSLTTLYRGVYGTTAGSHPAGTQFARIDQSVGRFPYPNTLVGQTIYLKFLSFNIVGGALQNLAEVLPYTYTTTGAGKASVSTTVSGSFTGTATANEVVQRYVFAGTAKFPVGLAGSQGTPGVAATASTTYAIQKNGADVGSMIFAAAATTATFTMPSATTFMTGDVLTVVAPSTPDATLANLAWTFIGSS